MSEIIKHVGMINNTGKRCVIAFLQVPNKETHALVVDTEALPERIHDPLMSLLRSSEAQQLKHFGEILGRRMMPDTGRTVLEELHTYGYLQAQPVENITLFPRPNVKINLKDMLEAMGQLEKTADEEAGIITKEVPNPVELIQESVKAEMSNQTEDEKMVAATNLLVQASLLDADATAMREKAYLLAPNLRPVVDTVKPNNKKEVKGEPKAPTTVRKNNTRATKTI